jgi:hypothetical protein
MTLQIENSGASIKITQNGGSRYISKPYLIDYVPTATQPGGIVREGIITIKYQQGDDFKDFSFTWTDCTSPVAADIQELVDTIEGYNDGGDPAIQEVSIVNPIGSNGTSESVSVVIASDQTPIAVKPLLAQGVGRTLTTTNTSANTALTAGIKAVSIYARNSDAYYSIGNTSQTATSAKGFIASGERIDLDVSGYATPNIAVIFGPSAAAAILMVTELS